MRKYLTGATSLVALILCACSGEGKWMGTVRDSAGVTIVENTLESIWSVSDQWTLEEELRIGAIEGDPDYQFGAIGFIAVDSRDRLFVMDAMAQHIKVFSPEGRYEQTIGGPGAGPGELGQGAITLFMGPGDTLLVPDLGNQRINRYAPDGTSLGSFRLDRSPHLIWQRAQSVRIEADPPLAVELDGDIRGWTPHDFTLLPAAIDVMTPRALEES